jgi:hypothetical protein
LQRALSIAVALVLAAFPRSAAAEMDASEYEVRKALPAKGERGSVQSEIEAEERMLRRREAERLEREQAQAREREAVLAARPYPVRLIEARCNGCHRGEDYGGKRYGWLGWHSVILRMQLLNGAQLGPRERGVIARHLSEEQPAAASWLIVEWAIAAGTCLAVAVSPFVLPCLRRRRRKAGSP